MIKYLGSKRLLLPHILAIVRALPDVRRVADLFSGTARVGHALKAAGYDVLANDHNGYAHVLARCYVQADAGHVVEPARALLAQLAALPGRPGYFTRTFCEEARFVHPRNGARVDAMRAAIADMELPGDVEAVLLTALIEATDRVDSTTGVQMAYLKAWAPRALRDLELRLPAVLPGAGRALGLDAAAAARSAPVDLVYLDPPYNQHSYRSNYHVWETLALGDRPEAYGVARKRLDCRTHKSAFNSRPGIADALSRVLSACRTRHLLVSFSDEGFLDRGALEALLAPHGSVSTFGVDHPRYVGARIGIYNPRGERVGRVGHVRNREQFFFCSPSHEAHERVAAALADAAEHAEAARR